jgi:hypothetical protein
LFGNDRSARSSKQFACIVGTPGISTHYFTQPGTDRDSWCAAIAPEVLICRSRLGDAMMLVSRADCVVPMQSATWKLEVLPQDNDLGQKMVSMKFRKSEA